MSLCAICTSERGPFTQQPLGKDDALVSVCGDCDEPAFEKRGPERAYEPSGYITSKAMKEATARMPEVGHPKEADFGRKHNAADYADKRPAGWRVYRVPIRLNGIRITQDAAWLQVQENEWCKAGRVKYGGFDHKFYLWFYAPDVKLAIANDVDALADIRQYEVKS